MALLSPKVIAQVSSSSASELAMMSWEWIMRADGQVFYRLTTVDGRREMVVPGQILAGSRLRSVLVISND